MAGVLAGKKVGHVKVGGIKLSGDEGNGDAEDAGDTDVDSAEKKYLDGMELVESISEDLKLGKRINANDVKDVIHSMIEIIKEDSSHLLTLVSLKSHDDYTFTHSVDVSILTLAQVETLGFDEKMLNDIGAAALLHDTGKLLVPGDLIRKPGKLEPEEWEIIKRHSANGARVLAKTSGLSDLAPIVAFEHHQKFDRSGYPEQPGKKGLNLISMMTSISDVYDALRSNRPYSPEMASEKAAEIMFSLSGKDFEPALLDRFMRMVGVYPAGTVVCLDTGEIGLVVRANPRDTVRPSVKIIRCERGRRKENPEVVDLMERERISGEFTRSIVSSVINPEEAGIEPREYM